MAYPTAGARVGDEKYTKNYGFSAPAMDICDEITPSANWLNPPPRALYLAAESSVTLQMRNADSAVTVTLGAGWHPLCVDKVTAAAQTILGAS